MFKHNFSKEKKTIKLSNRRSRNELMNFFENEILYVFHYFKIALLQVRSKTKKEFLSGQEDTISLRQN